MRKNPRLLKFVILVQIISLLIKIEPAWSAGLYEEVGTSNPLMPPSVLGWNSPLLEALSTPEEIDKLINDLTNPQISAETKRRILMKLSAFISDENAAADQKIEIAHSLLGILKSLQLTEALNSRIITCLRNVIFLPSTIDAKKTTLIEGLISSLSQNLGTLAKDRILAVLSYLISAKDEAGNYIISSGIKERIADLLIPLLQGGALDSDPQRDAYLKIRIIICLRNVILLPSTIDAKKTTLIEGLISSLSPNLGAMANYRILAFLSYLISTKDEAGNYIISSGIKERIADLLSEKLITESLDAEPGDNINLKKTIIDCLRKIVLVPEVSLEKKGDIIETLTTYFNPNLDYKLKKAVLLTLAYFISGKDKAGNFLVPVNIKEGMISFLVGKLNAESLDANTENNIELKIEVITCLRRILLVPEVSLEKKGDIIETLTTYFNPNLDYKLKKAVLFVLAYLISAKDSNGESLVPISFKEEMISFLTEKLKIENLDTDAEDNIDLKKTIIDCLRKIVLVPEVDLEKKRGIVNELTAYFNSANLDIELKINILSVLSDFISAKDTAGNFLVPVNIKEGMISFLLDKLRAESLDASQKNNDILKSLIVTCLRKLSLVPEINQDQAKRESIMNPLIDALTNNNLSEKIKEAVISNLSILLGDDSKNDNTNVYLLPAIVKEYITDKLMGLSILSNSALSDSVKKELLSLLGDVLLAPNLGLAKKNAVLQYLFDSLSNTNEEFKGLIFKLLGKIGKATGTDTEIRNAVLNKFLDLYANEVNLDQKEMFASYLVGIGQADANLKDDIATALNLSGKQLEIWNKFAVLALSKGRSFSSQELEYIYKVLDNLSSADVERIIKPIKVFSAINSTEGMSGWYSGGMIRITENLYNPADVAEFIKFIAHEIGKAYYSETLSGWSKTKFPDVEEFSRLFEDYIKDSRILIGQAIAEAIGGNNTLFDKVKIIIRLFYYTITTENTDVSKSYIFKINNGEIERTVVTLGDNDLPA